MPRRARITVANYPHHIVQRGHNRRAVFVTDRDRTTYLETLREFRNELGLKVYGYCLMTNHVHLIVDPGNDENNLGLLMKRLAGRHTRRINKLERRTGTSWKNASSAARSNPTAICLRAHATLISIQYVRGWLPDRRTMPGRATARASAS